MNSEAEQRENSWSCSLTGKL